ncbi:MAG: hypothetical protein KDB27_22010 [Planctomycetales bacterium]|nr:hypothetical protein [Planctomycetales bacterium]
MLDLETAPSRQRSDFRSSARRQTVTLGKPIGSLRICEYTSSNRIVQRIAIPVTSVAVVFDMYGLIICGLITVLILLLMCAAKSARLLDVYEHGVRFNDYCDTFDGRMELSWDQFDTHFNRIQLPVERHVLFDELRQVTFKVRLAGAHRQDRSHQLSVYARPSDKATVDFIVDMLNCAEV